MKNQNVWSRERIEVTKEALRSFLKMVDYERVTEGATPKETYEGLVPVVLAMYDEGARLMLTGESVERILAELISVMKDPSQ